MEPRLSCPGQITGNTRQATRKICGLMKRGGSLDIPKPLRSGDQTSESPVKSSADEVKPESKLKPFVHHSKAVKHVSSQAKMLIKSEKIEYRDKEINSARQSKENSSGLKQNGLKAPTENAVPTFGQKLTLAHRRRLGMAKQWSMDETQSWFRQAK